MLSKNLLKKTCSLHTRIRLATFDRFFSVFDKADLSGRECEKCQGKLANGPLSLGGQVESQDNKTELCLEKERYVSKLCKIRIAFTANGKHEIRVYVFFLNIRAQIDENSAK